jgi:hypothetical protein
VIYNKAFGTEPYLAHAPGKLEFLPLWQAVKTIALNLPPISRCSNVEFITFNNGGTGYNDKPLGLFETSAKLCGIPCTVLGQGHSNWSNKSKIPLLLDHLQHVQQPYVLVADSSDVVIVNKLNGLVESFSALGCEACFNSERMIWPPDLPTEIVEFEKSHGSHLNAGLWMAKTSFAREFLTESLSYHPVTEYFNSEQIYMKMAYVRSFPRIQVDHHCNLFQGLNRVGSEELSITALY